MDSRVVKNEVHENDEHYPHIDPLEQGLSHIWKSVVLYLKAYLHIMFFYFL